MQKKIKIVFFDIGGVLLNLHPEEMGRFWRESSNVSLEADDIKFPWEEYYKFERGQASVEDFHRALNSSLPDGKTISLKDFIEGWNRLVGTETRSVKTLREISKKIPVWLLSNTNSVHIENLKDRYSFLAHTSGEIYSYAVGLRKPEHEIYHEALKMSGSRAEEALFIDDLEENIKAAMEVGMDGIVYKSAEDLDVELIKRGLLDA